MPLNVVLSLIGVTAVSNIGLQWRAGSSIPMRRSLFIHILLFDTLMLTVLLACTGGVHNPFASLYLVHVAMAAVALGSAAARFIALRRGFIRTNASCAQPFSNKRWPINSPSAMPDGQANRPPPVCVTN